MTVVGLAYYVQEALAVAEELAGQGISVEVIDPRTLVPLDVETIRASVRKTGRLVIVDEAPPTCSAASEIAALVVEDPATFRALKAAVAARVRGARAGPVQPDPGKSGAAGSCPHHSGDPAGSGYRGVEIAQTGEDDACLTRKCIKPG